MGVRRVTPSTLIFGVLTMSILNLNRIKKLERSNGGLALDDQDFMNGLRNKSILFI